MAADTVNSDFAKLKISLEEYAKSSTKSTDMGNDGNNPNIKWGLRVTDLYRLALLFYREKEGKAMNLSYQDKLKLVAYTQQVSHGKFNAEKLPPLGVLDVIGRDRRLAWQALGDMSQVDAMRTFVDMIESLCPLFRPFIEAHKRDAEEKEKEARAQEVKRQQEEEQKKLQAEQEQKEEEEALRQEAQRRRIQEALNQQTFVQFKSYAEQQFPGNPEQQAVLIRQLQEQHYHQYMQQLFHQQQSELSNANENGDDSSIVALDSSSLTQLANSMPGLSITTSTGTIITNGNVESGSDPDAEEDISGDFPAISPASMWTRKDVKTFKESIRRDASDAVIKVGHGETVTVRVPTHKKGSCLVWEFATDHYDIGFGVFFEWTKPTSQQVTVHISESEEEEDEDEEEEDEEEMVYSQSSDIEAASNGGRKSNSPVSRPLLSMIVPVYRRDCQDEVYAGTHTYPGEGVYLLKFDNSYSLWRSKTLYYRVCYTQ